MTVMYVYTCNIALYKLQRTHLHHLYIEFMVLTDSCPVCHSL